MAELQVELGSELLSQLTHEEQAELGHLTGRLQQLKEEVARAQSTKLQAQVAAQELEDLLTGNLQQRQQVPPPPPPSPSALPWHTSSGTRSVSQTVQEQERHPAP